MPILDEDATVEGLTSSVPTETRDKFYTIVNHNYFYKGIAVVLPYLLLNNSCCNFWAKMVWVES